MIEKVKPEPINQAKPEPINLQAALGEIGNMARSFRAFSEASNALRALAGYDQLVAERTAAAAAAGKQLDALRAEVAGASSELVRIKAEAEAIAAAATERASAIVGKATGDAEALLAAAKEDAEGNRKRVADQAFKAGTKSAAAEVARLEARMAELKPLVDKAERAAAALA